MTEEQQTQIVEINGIKMEVDLRHARVIHDNLRIGTKVKIMVKNSYGSPVVHPGVIVGFEPFRDMPTIVVAYLVLSYSEAKLEIATINSKTAETYSLVPAVDDDLPIDRAQVMSHFEREILKKRREIEDIMHRRDFFTRNFALYFRDYKATNEVGEEVAE